MNSHTTKLERKWKLGILLLTWFIANNFEHKENFQTELVQTSHLPLHQLEAKGFEMAKSMHLAVSLI